jgi:hypothetical protein
MTAGECYNLKTASAWYGELIFRWALKHFSSSTIRLVGVELVIAASLFPSMGSLLLI